MTTGLKFKTQYQKNQYEEAYQKMVREGGKHEAVIYEKVGRIAWITLNRPEKMNALNDALYEGLLAGLGQAAQDPEVRVVVIKGAGRGFCAGHDLASTKTDETTPVHPDRAPTVRDYFGLERRRCSKYEDVLNFPKPIIAQVHGICIGAGENLQASCDITIVAEDAQIGVRGFGRVTAEDFDYIIAPWPSGSQKIRAGRMLPEITGKEAAELGLVNKAVPADKLEEEVNRWAEALASIPPDALTFAKETINGIQDITGFGLSQRGHYEGHLALQFVRFRPDETNMYKSQRDKGFKAFLTERAMHATPGEKEAGK